MLDRQDIQRFQRDGVLILPGFFKAAEIQRWRHQVLDFYQRPQTPADWRAALLNHSTNDFELMQDPTPLSHPKMRALYSCFHPHIDWHGENELVSRFPEADAEWIGARAPHLDFPVYAPLRTLANSLFYLQDVSPRGGAFMYWPGSHRIAWDYFHENPQDYLTQGELSQDQVFAAITRRMPGEPIAYNARAGDLLIWHALLLHSPSINQSHSARLAIIGRWGQRLQPQEKRFDFNADPWQHWQFQQATAAAFG